MLRKPESENTSKLGMEASFVILPPHISHKYLGLEAENLAFQTVMIAEVVLRQRKLQLSPKCEAAGWQSLEAG